MDQEKVTSVRILAENLSALGLCEGDTVMLHSSYKSLGLIEDGPDGIFQAFDIVLGKNGTLLLPAFSYDSVTPEQPVFDRQNTPSCIGFLPEYFRTRVAGVVRSMHATHSISAKGKLAEEMIADHEKDLTPVGEHSPLRKLRDMSGKILFLGCSTDHNTSMHGVEETVEPFYLFDRTKAVRYILRDGDRVIEQDAYRHSFQVNGRDYGQRYSRLIPLLTKNDVSFGKVASADCTLLSSPAVWEVGKKKLEECPDYFVIKL